MNGLSPFVLSVARRSRAKSKDGNSNNETLPGTLADPARVAKVNPALLVWAA